MKFKNLQNLVLTISSETGIPASQVSQVAAAMLDGFAELINSQGKFTSPGLVINGIVLPAKDGSDGEPARPERKVGRMTLRSIENDQ